MTGLQRLLICGLILATGVARADAGDFLDRHWRRPLGPQGTPPATYTPQEASLDPAACGACHQSQFDDWRASRHAQAMGPGVLGQLIAMDADAPDEHQSCLRCHAPLAEQAASLAGAIRAKARGRTHEQGLTCAGCHVRDHVRHGPPRRDGSIPKAGDRLPHDGWRASRAFEDARFCAACHQFEDDGYALNGKLLENTYEEWRASPAGREGRACQSCHMPDRRHLWRGIHDPEMTRAGVTIDADAPLLAGTRITGRLRITNTGTGHAFPTYVTPRVTLEISQVDIRARPIAGTQRSRRIARDVAPDLSRELADTRLLPGAETILRYDALQQRGAVALVYRVRVEPDAFYANFYRDVLRGNGTPADRKMMRQALAEATASEYVLFERREPLPKSELRR
ncbi:Cytochrome c554 and c-prime [Aromatoleum tolulyticum]|uniref:Cytochrome c554 and c-prime n=1 Tax=Aromatoleum tolulyticum TaxID=34027 RepID=A0A1N6PLJ0_9RHOO|nr:Cytochrome c554 and c-prime [Aromatoleum tolulyticum]